MKGEESSSIDFENIEVIDTKEAQEPQEPELISLDEILWSTGVSKTDFYRIKRSSRKRSLTPYKLVYINLAQEEGYTLKEIAENINTTTPAIVNLLTRNS